LIKAKKSLGQNFLTDPEIARRIVDNVSPRETDAVVEIGPGTGALTRLLVRGSGSVTAIEIDQHLAEELRRSLKSENLSILHSDALRHDWVDLINRVKSKHLSAGSDVEPLVRIVANLPYYISTPIIEKLLSVGRRIFDMTLMLQKEVADRITTDPGTRDYGYLSVLVQYRCKASKLFDVPPSAFTPVPKVWSTVIRLSVRENPAVQIENETKFFALVRASFAQRRKTILNNLKAASGALRFGQPVLQALEASSVTPQRRAETLSIEEFAALFAALRIS
jgi:16S rRNA (adenine1518-N6/adenine1519-N6)-dimethyltransferase